jgi:signal transduction histidine kinase
VTTFAVRDRSDADGCFLAYAAHELRGSITIQRTLAEVALADPEADTVALRQMGAQVAASCERQERLLEALLTLARSEFGQLRREPVDLAETAAGVLEVHAPRGLRMITTLEPGRMIGDPELVERLVANLVSNAIRHNVPGGRLDVATYAAAGRARLTVANTGPPIPTGAVPRLFQPFQRLGADTGGARDGVGLGLAIVQAIADAHDANVNAEARAAGGLRVEIDFQAV